MLPNTALFAVTLIKHKTFLYFHAFFVEKNKEEK